MRWGRLEAIEPPSAALHLIGSGFTHITIKIPIQRATLDVVPLMDAREFGILR